MYCLDPGTFLPALRAWWADIAPHLPISMAMQVESTGDIIDSVSGNLTGTWTGPVQAPVQGGGTSAYSAASGVVVTWFTGTILDNHRLRGRTFVVPVAGASYDVVGTLGELPLSDFRTSSVAFVTASAANFVIWHRPFLGAPATATRPARPARAGGHAIVTSSRVLDKVAVLRSRRD